MTRIAIILLVNLVFYFKTLGYQYSSDDIPVSLLPKERVLIKRLFYILEGRSRSTPHIDHFITTIFHALVCVFIYLGFGATDVSFIAALLFSINPANNQGSVWISGRGYVLPTLFILMAMTLPQIGPLFLLFATYFNIGFLAPLALLGSQHAWMCLFLPVLWYINFRRFKKNVKAKMEGDMISEDKKIKWQKLILATKTFGFYFTHALIPVKTTFYHSFLQSLAGSGKARAYSFCDRFFWIGLLAILTISTYLIITPWSIISFGLLWFCIGIAPFLNLMRMSQEIAERYMYLPNAGLMIVLASILIGNPVMIAMFLTMYATKMWFYMDAYQDDFYLSEIACMNSPNSWFAWHVKAMKRWDAHSANEALIFWTMAHRISPKEFKLNFNLATCLVLCNKQKEALEYLDIAAKNIPEGQEERSWDLIHNFINGTVSVLL